MDKFGNDYVVHNLPLLIVSGLEEEKQINHTTPGPNRNFVDDGGFRIKISLPPVQTELATLLLQSLLSHDGSESPWKTQSPSARESKLFKVRSIGRTYTLPARKAPPPPHSPRLSAADSDGQAPPVLALHSPLSPLTPSSPLFPDGIISSHWIAKHQVRLPSVFIACFVLTSDPNTSSLQDNKTKTEINEIRSVLSSTNYKTKLVVILLADGPLEHAEGDERIATIRRATNLDPKSLYCLPVHASPADVVEFTNTILVALYPVCIEYYRDLSKHARRKRNRNTVPPPTIPPTTAHALPQHGWNVRYEFKLGVFAEFRQEMDAACRNYETAYDNLFSPEMIESIATWSPRFNEARLLADVIALRILRCLLWTGQSTTAVKSWISHRDRIKDFVNRRGNGTQNYGWEAWQSTWSKTMAALIARAEIPALKAHSHAEFLLAFAKPEKTIPTGERFSPWELLHHEGYWLDLARTHTVSRRNLALQIPEEDRQPPGRSPASLIARKADLYDTYLALEPHAENPVDDNAGFDYVTDIASDLETASTLFTKRGQLRTGEILQLRRAAEYVQASMFTDASNILLPLWKNQAWRQSGWWPLLQQVGEALLKCTRETNDTELMVRLAWELGNSVFIPNAAEYDLRHVLENFDATNAPLSIAIDARETLSRVVPAFVFVSEEVHIGELVECQFALQSCSHTASAPIKLKEVKVVFEGSFKPIYFVSSKTDEAESPLEVLQDVTLQESSTIESSGSKRSSAGAIASLTGQTNLTLYPGQTRIFNIQIAPREAGEASVASVTLILEEEKYNLMVTTPVADRLDHQWWEMKEEYPVARIIGSGRNASQIEVLPKPPKMEVDIKDFRKTYYTNEDIELNLHISNLEEESASVSVQARLASPIEKAATFRWTDDQPPTEEVDSSQSSLQTLPARDLGTLNVGSVQSLSLSIANTAAALDHELEILVKYKLASDQETILTKTLLLDIAVVRPFESNYEFLPRLNEEPWPSFFEASLDVANQPGALGLKQIYSINASIASFATESIIIEAILLTATKVSRGATCTTSMGVLKQDPATQVAVDSEKISTQIEPEQIRIFTFELAIQKLVLGDRDPVRVDLALEIGWRRPNSDQVNTSILEVPHVIASMAEPRVMLTREKVNTSAAQTLMYSLNFWIENPSMHFLTFNMGMESSEDFAFSGPKASSVSLVPISRYQLKYRILPNKHKEWIKVQLNVVDAYFGQTLKIQPAGEGVKVDKKGNVLVYIE